MADGAVMIVGGTSGLGLEVARHYVEAGRKVIVTGHRPEHAPSVAKELGGQTEGLVFDLSEPPRSPPPSPAWAPSTTWCWRRSHATRTRSGSTTPSRRGAWQP